MNTGCSAFDGSFLRRFNRRIGSFGDLGGADCLGLSQFRPITNARCDDGYSGCHADTHGYVGESMVLPSHPHHQPAPTHHHNHDSNMMIQPQPEYGDPVYGTPSPSVPSNNQLMLPQPADGVQPETSPSDQLPLPMDTPTPDDSTAYQSHFGRQASFTLPVAHLPNLERLAE